MCRAASRAGSYQEAADDLAASTGLQPDPRDLGRMVAALAPGLPEALTGLDPSTAPKPTPTPIPVLYVSCDGTGTPMRREELAGIKGKQPDGSARRRGLDQAKQVVYIGDGAAWVWENCRLTFPGAIEILDFYHASEHVGQLAAALHDNDPVQASATRSRWCHEMKQTSPAALLAECYALLDPHPDWSESKRQAIQLQINYLESHSTRTEYGHYQANGWFIGSGVIEAGCKTVIGRRLKQSGMFWSQTGAEDILSLRCLVLGPHFDATWKARREILDQQQAKSRRWSSGSIILPS